MLEQDAQRSCGCPIPERVQGQDGWSSAQLHLGEGVPALPLDEVRAGVLPLGQGGWNQMIFIFPSNSNHSNHSMIKFLSFSKLVQNVSCTAEEFQRLLC